MLFSASFYAIRYTGPFVLGSCLCYKTRGSYNRSLRGQLQVPERNVERVHRRPAGTGARRHPRKLRGYWGTLMVSDNRGI
jgi:hypothetical protein